MRLVSVSREARLGQLIGAKNVEHTDVAEYGGDNRLMRRPRLSACLLPIAVTVRRGLRAIRVLRVGLLLLLSWMPFLTSSATPPLFSAPDDQAISLA
jgi:hypothetical protein